eukprot:8296014-Pyramimonas_sp.AAC.1
MRSEFIVKDCENMDTAIDIALASRCDDICQQLNELKEAQKVAETRLCEIASTPTPRPSRSPSMPLGRRRGAAPEARSYEGKQHDACKLILLGFPRPLLLADVKAIGFRCKETFGPSQAQATIIVRAFDLSKK